MSKLYISLFAILFFSPSFIFANNNAGENTSPQKLVSGVVTDAHTGEPMVGVSVQIKNTTRGVTTDTQGKFSINVEEDAVLVITYAEYATQEVSVQGASQLSIQLSRRTADMDEVVVVGYGTQRKRDVTSAVASIKSEEFTQGFTKDPAQLIQGKVAGISIATPSGSPNANTQITLRGANSLYGSSTPLVLVDGIPGTLNTVAPEDIESIDVLKDGSAAAIYGTRGTNGVILITTRQRRGAARPATISYNGYVTVQTIARKMEFLTAEDYRRLIAEGVKGFNQNVDPNAPGYSGLGGTNDEFGATTDWLDAITRTPVSHTHNLTLQGGNPQTSYTASLNFRDWQGIFKRSDASQLIGRLDINHAMFDGKLRFNVNMLSRSRKSYMNDADNFYNGIYRQALIRNPTEPIKTPEGAWNERDVYMYSNPLRNIEETDLEFRTNELRLSGNVIFSPIKDLNIKLLVAGTKTSYLRGVYETFNHRTSQLNGRPGFALRGNAFERDELLEFTTDYSKVLGEHRFTVLGGYSYQYRNNEDFSAFNSNFPSDRYGWNRLESGDAIAFLNTTARYGPVGMNSNQLDWRLIGFFGRLNYVWKDKYMLMASLRNEGSSKFGKNHKWGQFPAVSLGWRISNEPFMQSISAVSELKLRAGYGTTGTIPNDPYLSLDYLNVSNRMLYNGVFIQSIVPGSNANPDLRWEKKNEWNVGIDFGLHNNRISGSIDLYQRDTKDMLFNFDVPVPPYLYSTMWYNAGEMKNSGVEVLLTGIPVRTKNFEWNTNVTYAFNKNELVAVNGPAGTAAVPYIVAGYTGEPIQEATHRNYVGQPIGSFYGYKTIDIAADSTWIIEGEDGKSKPINQSTPTDKKILGNGIPKHTIGWNNSFRLKNWDMNINIRGAFGYQIMNFQRMFYENPKINQYNMLTSAFDPVYGKTPIYADLAYVSYYMERGDHIKLDNVSLGYTFKLNKSKTVKTARVYVAGLNLVTITGYKGIDPEVNRLGLSPGLDERDKYPTTRSFTFGANINF